MAEQLIVDTGFLRDTASRVATIRDEFVDANRNADEVAAAVGHPGLADRVRGFAHNWDHRRSELAEQLETVLSNLNEAAEAFESADLELAVAIEGDS